CPPPWWRTVIRPALFRPAVFRFGARSAFSGRSLVTSENVERVVYRRFGVYGRLFFSAIYLIPGDCSIDRLRSWELKISSARYRFSNMGSTSPGASVTIARFQFDL